MINAAVSPCSAKMTSASLGGMTVFGVITSATISATGAAPTSLYRHYQESFGLSPFMLTLIFAVYSFSLLTALLTAGSLSDYVGRRPVIFGALVLNALAMAVFMRADSAVALIAARVVQGFATGVATTTLGATILDANRARGPLLNSITPFAGLALGSLGSSALVTFAPAPAQLVFVVLLAASLSEALIVWLMPETAETRRGAFASLLPHLSIPSRARLALIQTTPVNVAAWALGGFNFSLMPSLVRAAAGLTSPFVAGIVVTALPLTGALAVLVLRRWLAEPLLSLGTSALAVGVAITLTGVGMQFVPFMLLGMVIAGFGFGAAFSGTLRTVLPLAADDERAGLLATFYVESYLAFSLPAVVVGLVAPMLGLPVSTYFYGAAIMALAVVSLIATHFLRDSKPADR